jgi:hypothetical protein
MEWIGTGFVLTVGGVRLRVRIALEDTPEPVRQRGARAGSKTDAWQPTTPASPTSERTGSATSLN